MKIVQLIEEISVQKRSQIVPRFADGSPVSESAHPCRARERHDRVGISGNGQVVRRLKPAATETKQCPERFFAQRDHVATFLRRLRLEKGAILGTNKHSSCLLRTGKHSSCLLRTTHGKVGDAHPTVITLGN
ncbi:MAG: hypothetical protein EBE86_006415 [Hormoscilla sp. GUM202]|nr:hypothetical protein [Hormoscilla sp. GUM202]